jgi:hypothetical protein
MWSKNLFIAEDIKQSIAVAPNPKNKLVMNITSSDDEHLPCDCDGGQL